MRIFKSLVALAGVTVLLLAGCTTKEQEIAVTGVKLSSTTLTLKVGETQTLTTEVEPSNANNKKVTWSTDDPDMNVISLNEGKVKGIAPGKAIVTVTTDDGGKKATCEVTVTKEGETPDPGPDPGPGGDTEVLASSIELDITNGNTLAVGGTVVVKATVKPDNATNVAKIAWSSSDEKVATVAGSGKEATITAVAAGKATITASLDGKSGSVEVTVEEPDIPVSNITMKPASASLTVGDEETFQAYIEPANATNINSVEWKIDDPSLADLNPTGNYCKVTAKAAGTATLTATVEGKSASAEITIKAGGSSHPEVEGFVDLGLPSGTLWSEKNLGASSASEAGDYYAWGETETKTYFGTDNYRFGDPLSSPGSTKYNKTDNIRFLDAEDDAATAALGGDFRIPTLGDWAELRNPAYCTWEWTTQDGKDGYLVSGKNGKSIFLPVTGMCINSSTYYEAELAYWTSTRDNVSSYDCYGYFGYLSGEGDQEHYLSYSLRYEGLAVRPVYAPRPVTPTALKTKETVEVERGKPYKLSASVEPADASQTIVWTTYGGNGEINMWTGEGTVDFGNGAYVYATEGTSGLFVEISVIVKPSYPVPEAVDMGFPSGTKWASWDLGASKPEETGFYFAWGETEPKLNFEEENYKWYNESTERISEYNDSFLKAEDDAAAVHLQGGWRIPFKSEFEELIDHTSMEVKTTDDGVQYVEVKSNQMGYKDKKLIFPYSGYMWGILYVNYGSRVVYPTAMPFSAFSCWTFDKKDNTQEVSDYPRYYGLPIRPVLSSTQSQAAAVRSLGPVSPTRNVAPRRSQKAREEGHRKCFEDKRHNFR